VSDPIPCSTGTTKHSWGSWVAYDPHVIEMELTGGFKYYRSCRITGCSVYQKAEELVPRGKVSTRQKKRSSDG